MHTLAVASPVAYARWHGAKFNARSSRRSLVVHATSGERPSSELMARPRPPRELPSVLSADDDGPDPTTSTNPMRQTVRVPAPSYAGEREADAGGVRRHRHSITATALSSRRGAGRGFETSFGGASSGDLSPPVCRHLLYQQLGAPSMRAESDARDRCELSCLPH